MNRLVRSRLPVTLGAAALIALVGAGQSVAATTRSTNVEGATYLGNVLLGCRCSGPIREVRWTVDGPAHLALVDRRAPFRFTPDGGKGWDTTAVPDGAYTLSVTLIARSGRRSIRRYRFRVSNLVNTPSPAVVSPTPARPNTASPPSGTITVSGAYTATLAGRMTCLRVGTNGIDFEIVAGDITSTGNAPVDLILVRNDDGTTSLSGYIGTSVTAPSSTATLTPVGTEIAVLANLLDIQGNAYQVSGRLPSPSCP